ncbi:MAG: hypothetical protein U1F87_16370 [Kiritimatiellia bacterium]
MRLTVRSLQATNVVDYTFTTGAPATEQVFSFAGASAIPDGTGATLNIALPVSGVVGNITDVNFAFTGTNCGVATGTGCSIRMSAT